MSDEGEPLGLSEQAVQAFARAVGRPRDSAGILAPLPETENPVSGPPDAPVPPLSAYEDNGRPAKTAALRRPHYWGHRQRLRDRFAAGGAESMPDYELVEMLLFNAVPKRDVKPLAKQLLADFGGIEPLVAASRERLAAHPQIDRWIVHQIKLAEAFALRLAKVRIAEKPVLGSTVLVIEYLRTRMAHQSAEVFRILFLDTQNQLIGDEEHGRGTINHVPAYPREVVKRALELGAAGVILAHNHPSGDPRPSEADLALTRRIKAGLATVGIELHDHIIVGKGRELSLAALDALD